MKCVFFLVGMVILSSVAYSQETSDWPMQGYDVSHTGASRVKSNLSYSDISLLCTFDSKTHITSTVTADLDGDGITEIIFGTGSTLQVLSSDCTPVWSYTANGTVHAPAVFDLKGEGDPEVLFASEDGILHALDWEGKEIWRFKANGSIRSSPVSADLDNASALLHPGLETVIGAMDGYIYVLDSDGNLLRSDNVVSPVEYSPSLGDINSDGKLDILAGSATRGVAIFEFPGFKRWDYQTGSSVVTPTVQKKPSGKPGIIAGTGDGTISDLIYNETVTGQIKIYDKNGNATFQNKIVSSLGKPWDYKTGDAITSAPLLADLDKDGNKEIIVGSQDKNLYAFYTDGTLMFKKSVNGKILASPVAADIDGDKRYEILFGSSDGVIHLLDSTGFRRWSYETKSYIDEPAAISDLDRDGNAELIVPASNKLYVFGKKAVKVMVATTTTTLPEPEATTTTTTSTTSTSTTTTTTTTSSTTTTKYVPPVKMDSGDLAVFLTGFFLVCGSLYLGGRGVARKTFGSWKKKKEYKKDLWTVAGAADNKEPKTGLRGL